MKREWKWALQRMSRIIHIWKKLDRIDRIFLLDKWRCEHPDEWAEVSKQVSA